MVWMFFVPQRSMCWKHSPQAGSIEVIEPLSRIQWKVLGALEHHLRKWLMSLFQDLVIVKVISYKVKPLHIHGPFCMLLSCCDTAEGGVRGSSDTDSMLSH